MLLAAVDPAAATMGPPAAVPAVGLSPVAASMASLVGTLVGSLVGSFVASLVHAGEVFVGCGSCGKIDSERLASAHLGHCRTGSQSMGLADPELVPQIEQAVKDHVAGSPVNPDVKWTNRTPTELAAEL